MSFWNKFSVFVKDNTFNERDYQYTLMTLDMYMRKTGLEWSHLTLNMQQILIDAEIEFKIKGLVPKDAQLNHCCYY